MIASQPLQWVARNRARREPPRRAGDFVAQAVRAAIRTDGAVLALLAERLAGTVDDEFRRHCRARAVRSRRFVVSVDAPSMVSLMQARWRKTLLAAIRRQAPRAGVADVGFEFGLDGLMFTPAVDRSPPRDATGTSSQEWEAGTNHG